MGHQQLPEKMSLRLGVPPEGLRGYSCRPLARPSAKDVALPQLAQIVFLKPFCQLRCIKAFEGGLLALPVDNNDMLRVELIEQFDRLRRDDQLMFGRVFPHQRCKQLDCVWMQPKFWFIEQYRCRHQFFRLEQDCCETDKAQRTVGQLVPKEGKIAAFFTPFQLNRMRVQRIGTQMEFGKNGATSRTVSLIPRK